MAHDLTLYNSLGRKKQVFVPIKKGKVRLYSCGPTVYDYAHIGNLRYFTFVDTLRRVLEHFGYSVHHVMNITDVGHLVGDGDLGQDKMLKALSRESERQGKQLSVWDVAEFYTKMFVRDMSRMNILPPVNLTPATKHIPAMITLIEKLVAEGVAYVTTQAVYFDVTKFKDYTKLSGQKLEDKIVGSRDDVVVDPGKKHPADFRLWQLDQPDHAMLWDSPWGKGFPGWHIECSAMAMEYLGETIDIHTGGIDHIPVHHTNEIAQSEAATHKPFANFWLHSDFLKVNDEKMSKSKGNAYNLDQILDKNYSALALRTFYLSAHYRTPLNFTWEAMNGAEATLKNLLFQVVSIRSIAEKLAGGPEECNMILSDEIKAQIERYKDEFDAFLQDDLNIPGAWSVLWKVLKAQIHPYIQYEFISYVDHVFGYEFMKVPTLYSCHADSRIVVDVSKNVIEMVDARVRAKQEKDWKKADVLRNDIQSMGFILIDSPYGSFAVKKD